MGRHPRASARAWMAARRVSDGSRGARHGPARDQRQLRDRLRTAVLRARLLRGCVGGGARPAPVARRRAGRRRRLGGRLSPGAPGRDRAGGHRWARPLAGWHPGASAGSRRPRLSMRSSRYRGARQAGPGRRRPATGPDGPSRRPGQPSEHSVRGSPTGDGGEHRRPAAGWSRDPGAAGERPLRAGRDNPSALSERQRAGAPTPVGPPSRPATPRPGALAAKHRGDSRRRQGDQSSITNSKTP